MTTNGNLDVRSPSLREGKILEASFCKHGLRSLEIFSDGTSYLTWMFPSNLVPHSKHFSFSPSHDEFTMLSWTRPPNILKICVCTDNHLTQLYGHNHLIHGEFLFHWIDRNHNGRGISIHKIKTRTLLAGNPANKCGSGEKWEISLPSTGIQFRVCATRKRWMSMAFYSFYRFVEQINA